MDISNPTNPDEIGNYDTAGTSLAVYLDMTFAYVADKTNGLVVVDVYNPTNPQLISYYDTEGEAKGVCVNGSYVYVMIQMDWKSSR